jgi:predicted DsbA family dithiol-disulfide isomerase
MSLVVTEYTDAACPWAWSAEPMRWRLRWLYGDGLRWRLRMIGLTSDPGEYARRGFTPERMAAGYALFAQRYGMPLATAPRPRLGATLPACRAVVAARLHAPSGIDAALLRRLRIHAMTRACAVLDEPLTIARAAWECGIEPLALERWCADPAVERALDGDLAAARRPSPAGVALRHKLAAIPDEAGGGWRYTAPSLVFSRESDGAVIDVPGFQPSLAYEVAVAHLDPGLPRREPPASAGELLAWAGEPLATQEVAEVLGVERDEAAAALEESGAVAEPAGSDRFWTLPAAASGAQPRAA